MKGDFFYTKLTLEEKLRNVKLHVDDGVPLYEVQRMKGLNVASLKYFIALYRKRGEKAFRHFNNRPFWAFILI